MKKNLVAIALTGALLCTMSVQAVAAEVPNPTLSAIPTTEKSQSLSDSVLYYGQVKKIVTNKDGTISQLRLDSERFGEYVVNLSAETVWIDSGNHSADDPSDLKEGEGIYVFHSPVETASLPPQSSAFAIVRNIPQDVGCAQYHEVEAIREEDGKLKITTDNGGLFILADEETKISSYLEDASTTLNDIQPNTYIMAWYESYATVYPGQTYANHIMLLEEADAEALTRAGLVSLLHNMEGNPVVNYAMSYTDVNGNDSYAEAIRWASSKGLVSGYGNGSFCPNDVVSREQLVTILWRYAGSPMLMDYPGLTQFSDAGDISAFARQAMAWAHQKGLISATNDGLLAPHGTATAGEVEKIIQLLDN
ncbi:S-layer homology domain-containing protein [Anaerovorax sp. IOR16]|uniref:S-layer homology domain-containing protein n=1 Tax=Anaerovorax sp. IOR16 TaxID=2773458 RepID=UPI0019D105B7|nr:S-layer homology domain-containing protein [Anaerovorax sp. IOR16]